MANLDRIVQKQIEEATRTKYGKVKTTDQATINSVGQPNLSDSPTVPTIIWRVENYIFPLSGMANDSDAQNALDGKISVAKTVYTITSTMNGGFSAYLSGADIKGRTNVFTTRVKASSTRNIVTKIVSNIVRLPGPGAGASGVPGFMPMIRSENSDGTLNPNGLYPKWTNMAPNLFGGFFTEGRVNSPINFTLNQNEWVSLAFFMYGGYRYESNVIEVFKDIAFSLDAMEFVTKTPPSPPRFAGAIQTDYIDELAGNSKNILTIRTPTDSDWLGVGIYRASAQSNSNFKTGREVHRASAAKNTDLGRKYYWNVYGSTSESYIFSSEDIYQKNLIPNATFFYDTTHWTITTGGSGNMNKLVKREPWTAPHCMKSSANYSGAAKFDLTLRTSVMAVDSTKPYKLVWYVKTERATPTAHISASSVPQSALQISYYRNSTHNLLTSTPYQIKKIKYTEPIWTKYEETIHPLRYWPSANPSGLTGTSVLSHFVMPNGCTHLDIRFKMWNNHSARGILYFDGANLELNSGQPIIYNKSTTTGVVLNPVYSLTSEESTAYGVFRIPLRGRDTEIYAGHTTSAIGDKLYLSSAYHSKYGQGFDAGVSAINRAKNGNFLRWTFTGGQWVPTDWVKYGSPINIPKTWIASTAIYGSSSLGLYFDRLAVGAGSGIQQTWSGSGVPEVTYGFWLKLDTGAVVIGDVARNEITYKEPKHWWFSRLPMIKDSGPNHAPANNIIVDTAWHFHQIHLATANIINIGSEVIGTRCYVDGVQINYNKQGSGPVRNFPTIFDPKRILSGATPKPTSYVKCSSNSINTNLWTIRCVYNPSYPWFLKSTSTGRYEMPRPVIWSFGDNDTVGTNLKQWLSYVPFRNTDSSGGFFQWYGNDFTRRMIIPGPRIEFKPWDPIHLVCVFYNAEGDNDFSRYTKMYVNGMSVGSASGTSKYGANAWSRTFTSVPKGDNIIIGAYKGAETTTALSYAGFDVTTAYGHANGVISEFRVDNYAWSEEQVLEDLRGERVRYSPTAALDNIVYTHLADHIRDGSEKETFIYEDIGVKAGNYYSYALDAYDYLNNRSLLSATASIIAGDSIAPDEITSTGYALNKETNLALFWTNPTNGDFKHNKIYLGGRGTPVGVTYSSPGAYTKFQAGFVGYGFNQNYIVTTVDKIGNESSGRLINAKTKKGPLKRIDGSILYNVGGGLVNDKELLFKPDSLSWANIYFTTGNPRSPKYRDLHALINFESSAYPTIIRAPIKLGSVTGLALNTAYHLYLIDSANGRTNALRMRHSLSASVADSPTAYPIGTFFSGNSSSRGYFVPTDNIGVSPSQNTLVASRIESPSRDTYFDLQNSRLHNEDTNGNYTEIKSAAITYYDSAMGKSFNYPRIMKVIPAGLINVGASNSFESWGLRTFTNIPDILLVPTNVKTYSTAPGFGKSNHTAQSLKIEMDTITNSGCVPVVKLTTNKQIQTNTFGSILEPNFNQDTGQPYAFPVNLLSTFQLRSGLDTATACDTATGYTGSGFSGIGPNNSTAIARIEVELSFYASASPSRLAGYHLKLGWAFQACSAASNTYQEHGTSPLLNRYLDHKGFASDGTSTIIVGTGGNRTKHTKIISKNFLLPAPFKPMVTWCWASAEPKLFGAQSPEDITWSPFVTAFASSGAYWVNDMKIERITYFTSDGLEESQTGYGILSALLIDRG